MLRTGEDYIESLRDGREVWIDGERVADVPTHPAFAPIVGVRARIYDMAREPGPADLLSHADEESAELFAQSPPFSHLLAVYNNYDFSGPLDLVARYSGVADAAGK